MTLSLPSPTFVPASLTLNGMPCKSATFSNDLDGGIRWSAVLRSSLIDPTGIPDTEVFTLSASTPSGGTWESPALLCLDPDTKGGRQYPYVTLSGSDRSSYYLSGKGQSLATSHDNLATANCARACQVACPGAIVTQYGTSSVISGGGSGPTFSDLGVSDFRCQDFEITPQTSYGSFIDACCKYGGWNFRIGTSGNVEAFNVTNTAGSCSLIVDKWTRKTRTSQMYARIVMRKTSKYKTSYQFPLTKAGIFSQPLTSLIPSSVGCRVVGAANVVYCALYSETSGGQICGFFAMSPTAAILGIAPIITGAGLPAKQIVYSVAAPVAPVESINGTLIVHGAPSTSSAYSYDGPEEYIYPVLGVGVTPPALANQITRERRLVLETSLWPTLTDMQTRAPMLLRAANEALDTVECTCLFDPSVWPGMGVESKYGIPAIKVKSTSWTLTERSSNMTVTGIVLA